MPIIGQWVRICPPQCSSHPKNGTEKPTPVFQSLNIASTFLGAWFHGKRHRKSMKSRSFEHRSPHETYLGPTWTHVADVAIMLRSWVTLVTPGLRFATSQQPTLRPVSDGFCGTLFFSFWGDFEHHLHIEGICWDTMMPPVAWLMLKWDI